jgi:uncharacterized protein YkwD
MVRFLSRLCAVGCCIVLSSSASAEGQKPPKRSDAAQLLDYAGAQKFMLGLINRDRAKAGLSPVVLDAAASTAGLRHAQDMATKGFTGHIGTDGSVPEQRYTEGGGVHFAQENAACLFDGKARKLDPAPRFDPAKLAELQKMFMDELPPNDGHRQNVLKPLHNRVGIGLAQPEGVNQPCLAQEFVDSYGSYDALPPGGEGESQTAHRGHHLGATQFRRDRHRPYTATDAQTGRGSERGTRLCHPEARANVLRAGLQDTNTRSARRQALQSRPRARSIARSVRGQHLGAARQHRQAVHGQLANDHGALSAVDSARRRGRLLQRLEIACQPTDASIRAIKGDLASVYASLSNSNLLARSSLSVA